LANGVRGACGAIVVENGQGIGVHPSIEHGFCCEELEVGGGDGVGASELAEGEQGFLLALVQVAVLEELLVTQELGGEAAGGSFLECGEDEEEQ
jgi:hypothetical protein